MKYASALLVLFVVTTVVADVPKGEGDCDVCTAVVGLATKLLESNATAADFLHALDDACDLLKPIEGLCDKLAASADASLWQFLPELNFPGVICGQAGYCQWPCCATDLVPEQVHLAFGQGTDMVVSWVTLERDPAPFVAYGGSATTQDTHQVPQEVITYAPIAGWQGWVYHATLSGLKAQTRYWYSVGGANHRSTVYSFVSSPLPTDAVPFSILMVGDMGIENSNETIARMTADVLAGERGEGPAYAAVYHNGDISYSQGWMHDWDVFCGMVEAMAARVPYMVSGGNHDVAFGFAALKTRFRMPFASSNGTNNLYYAFSYGSMARFTTFATDDTYPGSKVWWSDDTSLMRPGTPQHTWFARALTSEENMAARWRFIAGHRPLRCVEAGGDLVDCQYHAPLFSAWLEDIVHEAGIDVVWSAHEHAISYSYPVYKDDMEADFDSPKYAVHVVNGAGGNREGLDSAFMDHLPDWSAWHASMYGYARVHISYDALVWEFVSSKTGEVVNTLRITK